MKLFGQNIGYQRTSRFDKTIGIEIPNDATAGVALCYA